MFAFAFLFVFAFVVFFFIILIEVLILRLLRYLIGADLSGKMQRCVLLGVERMLWLLLLSLVSVL